MTNLTNVQRCFVGLRSTGLCDDVICYIGQYLPVLTDKNIRLAVYDWCEGGKSKEKIEEMYGPISKWDVSRVTNMSRLFWLTEFNQNISNWDTSNVTNMHYMFAYTGSFNQPLNNWDVSNVEDMAWMFVGAINFNQPLNDWDVLRVTNMRRMFVDAKSFNPENATWNRELQESTGNS